MTTANSVSKSSRVPREKVYGVLRLLIDAGLVRKVITSPTAYKAVPFEEAVKLLVYVRQKALEKLSDDLTVQVQAYKSNFAEVSNSAESSFELVSGTETVLQDLRSSIEKAETSVDAVITWKSLLNVPQLIDLFRKARQRGVKIRLLFLPLQDLRHLQDFLRTNDMSFCSCRVISSASSPMLEICDEKKAMFFTNSEQDIKNSPAIVTNNANFLEIINTYFEKVWQTSQLCQVDSEAGIDEKQRK